MSRNQSRRTISVSARMLASAKAYAQRSDVPLSALTEFLLDHQLRTALDRDAFQAWKRKRDRRVLAAQRKSGANVRR